MSQNNQIRSFYYLIIEQKGSKNIKVEKSIELEVEGLKEEGGGKGRRRSGKLAKSQARYKQKSNRFRVKEAEEESFENNDREREDENNSDSKREKGKVEKEKSENSIDNAQMSVGNTHGNAITTETTHILVSTLQAITFCEDNSKVDTSPITISSLVK